MSAKEARRYSDGASASIFLLEYPPISLFKVFDKTIAGRNGDIPIRVYQAIDGKNLPIIVYFHGGGFVLRDIDSHDKVCRKIAKDNKAIVISVGYRLAPEHKFPKPLHDCYDATVWAAEHAASLNADSDRIVVMGDSAGGNLASAVCMMSRDLGGPQILHQVLIYPCTDGRLIQPSVDQFGEGYLLTKKMMRWFLDHYMSKPEDVYHPYFSLLLAEDLKNLPPAFVITAEYDPLKDEGRAYAKRLEEAGNKVRYKDYEGMIHAFISMPKVSPIVKGCFKDIQTELTKVLQVEAVN